jgi:hypothetical protein
VVPTDADGGEVIGEITGNFRAFTASFEQYHSRSRTCVMREATRSWPYFAKRPEVRPLVQRWTGASAGCTFRDGKALRIEIYLDPGDAFKAAGMRE